MGTARAPLNHVQARAFITAPLLKNKMIRKVKRFLQLRPATAIYAPPRRREVNWKTLFCAPMISSFQVSSYDDELNASTRIPAVNNYVFAYVCS